jgi:hypothetical protein
MVGVELVEGYGTKAKIRSARKMTGKAIPAVDRKAILYTSSILNSLTDRQMTSKRKMRYDDFGE